jgi:hypothetical protein
LVRDEREGGYGGGNWLGWKLWWRRLLWMRKLVRREGKLREKIIRNFGIFVEFL